LVGDRGDTSTAVHVLRPRRGDKSFVNSRQWALVRRASRQRNRVEQLVARLKQHHRVPTRLDKPTRHYLAWRTLTAIRLWP
jgi:hypothetical protein